jgi:hypothetical protein
MAMLPCVMIRDGGVMSNEITSLGDALNYLGIIGGLIAVGVAVIVGGAWVAERYQRASCRYRHPASVARRARIVAQRRARLDGRGVIK